MPTYIALVNWTDQGIRAINESPRRLDAAKKLLHDMGGELQSFFTTMGSFDAVAIYEASDDAVAARFSLKLAQSGSVRAHTLKAFPERAFREVVGALG